MQHTLPRLLAGTAVAGTVVLGLVACGGDDDTADRTDARAASAATTDAPSEADAATMTTRPTAPTSAAFPVTIEHTFGATTIEAAPERVVSLGYTEQDAIVAFGVQPVAVRYAFGPEDDVFFPWADEAAGDADPEILPRAEVNVEQIAALDPDLIMAVTAGLTAAEYDLLSEVAPVVVQPAEYVDFGTPWQVQTEVTGRALGRPADAAQMIADVEVLFADARADHPEFEGLSFALSGPSYEGQYPFHASSDPRVRIFTDLGFAVPAALDEIAGDQFYGALSREQADLLDTDVLVWQSGSPEERAGIEADPILSGLPVATAGHTLFAEGSDYDALQFVSVLSLPFLVDSLVPQLADAVAG